MLLFILSLWGFSGALATRLAEAEAAERLAQMREEEGELVTTLAASPAPKVIRVHADVANLFLRAISDLPGFVNTGMAHGGGSAAIVRSLVEKVIVHPAPTRTPPVIEVLGDLAPICGSGLGGGMVAEEGLEPPTRGL